jgi:hypothetical protein
VAELKGYMTVEASFIIPWVVFLFVFIIYSSYLMYDRCVLFQDSYAYSMRAADKQLTQADTLKYMEDNAQAQYGNKYMVSKTIRKKFTVTDKEVRTAAEGAVVCPAGPQVSLPGLHRWRYSAEARASRENPTRLLRIYRGCSGLITGGR